MRIGDIKRVVAVFYGLTRDQIEGPSRDRRLSWPRQVAMTLCRHYSRHSLAQIGQAFGGRDHTTVIHAGRTVARLTAASATHARDLALLCAQIESGLISLSSVWATAFDRKQPYLTMNEAIMEAEALRRGALGYGAALKAANANFSATRDAGLPCPASILSGPRVLRLCGPDSFRAERVAE